MALNGGASVQIPGGPPSASRAGGRLPVVVHRWGWVLAVFGAAAVPAVFVILTRARPAYDAMGFLVWGRQALHWNLNLNGAPSWKPLPLLATLPYALAGPRAQQWLWTFTAAAGAGAAIVLAARVAYRLSPVVDGRRWARAVGGLLAAYGVATMVGFMHLALIANSDRWIVALVLWAIDRHISAQPRAALVLLWLAALGRPEVWAFLLLYSAWLWRDHPETRRMALVTVLLVPAIWVVVPALTAKSWLQPSDLALGQATAVHGNKLLGVFDRLRTLTALPIQIAALVSIAIGVIRRDRGVLWLTAMALLWSVIEVVFALRGYSAVQRYLIEPAAILIVVAGVGAATALSRTAGPARWLGPLAVAMLVISLEPYNHGTLVTDHGLVSQAHTDARVIDQLGALIASDGGSAKLLACGQPVTTLTYQSTLAFDLGLNVGSVEYLRDSTRRGPVVLFKPNPRGWSVRVIRPAAATTCTRLDRTT